MGDGGASLFLDIKTGLGSVGVPSVCVLIGTETVVVVAFRSPPSHLQSIQVRLFHHHDDDPQYHPRPNPQTRIGVSVPIMSMVIDQVTRSLFNSIHLSGDCHSLFIRLLPSTTYFVMSFRMLCFSLIHHVPFLPFLCCCTSIIDWMEELEFVLIISLIV